MLVPRHAVSPRKFSPVEHGEVGALASERRHQVGCVAEQRDAGRACPGVIWRQGVDRADALPLIGRGHTGNAAGGDLMVLAGEGTARALPSKKQWRSDTFPVTLAADPKIPQHPRGTHEGVPTRKSVWGQKPRK